MPPSLSRIAKGCRLGARIRCYHGSRHESRRPRGLRIRVASDRGTTRPAPVLQISAASDRGTFFTSNSRKSGVRPATKGGERKGVFGWGEWFITTVQIDAFWLTFRRQEREAPGPGRGSSGQDGMLFVDLRRSGLRD